MVILSYLFSFSGRITRMHWWIGNAVIFAVALALNIYVAAATTGLEVPAAMTREEAMKALAALAPVLGVMAVAFVLLTAMSLAFNIRRYHDRDKTGWWALMQFAPLTFLVLGLFTESLGLLFAGALTGVIVPIWQIVELGCLAGTGGSNSYGPDPGFGAGGLDREIAAMHGGKSKMPRATAPAPQMSIASMPAAAGPVRFGKR